MKFRDNVVVFIEKYKYVLTFLVFLIFILFLGGDSTLLKRYAYDKKINALEREIEKNRKEKELNEIRLQALHSDDESLIRYAREQFLMTAPDEELFIIK